MPDAGRAFTRVGVGVGYGYIFSCQMEERKGERTAANSRLERRFDFRWDGRTM